MHEGGCCITVYLDYFCVYCINLNLLVCVSKICLPIVFMKDFTLTSCLHFKLDIFQIPVWSDLQPRGRQTWLTWQSSKPIRAGCHCQHISLQFSRKPRLHALFTLSSLVNHKKRQWHVNERCIQAYSIHIQHKDRAESQGELTVAMLQSRTQ